MFFSIWLNLFQEDIKLLLSYSVYNFRLLKRKFSYLFSYDVRIIKYEHTKIITTIIVKIRLKGKYQQGNDKYLLNISSTN